MSGETTRDITIRVSIKQITGEPLKVPDLRSIETGVKATSKSMGEVAKETDKVKAAAKAAADEVERLKKLDEAKLKAVAVGDSFKAAGEGAFTMARGAAFLFTSTDDGFAKMAGNIAKVQGGFDLFKGSFETIKSVTEGAIKLKAATGALTVSTAIQTAASTGLSVALTTVKGAAAGLYVALGPVGIAALAVAAAGAAIYAAWKWFASDEPAKKIKKTNDALKATIAQSERVAGLQADLDNAFSAGDRGTASSNKRLEIAKQQNAITGNQINLEKTRAIYIKAAEQAKAREVMAAVELSNWTESALNTQQSAVNIEKARLQFQERMQEIAQIELDLTKQKGDELSKQKTEQEGLLKSVKERIKAEKEALQSAEAKFGQLTKREQQRVIDIGQRGGPQNRKEAELVSKAGFDDAGTKFFAKQGRDAGFSKASRSLGGKTEDDLRKLEKERGEIEARLEQVKNSLVTNQKRQLELLDGVINELTKVEQVESRLAELEKKLAMKKARDEASKK